MKRFLPPVFLLLMCLVACSDKKEQAPETALQTALEALEKEDYDSYLKAVDFGADMDSAQEAYMRDVLRQHLSWRRAKRENIVSIDMVDAIMKGDTVCTVYYQYTYADSTREVASQKMVRKGEVWKLRLRN